MCEFISGTSVVLYCANIWLLFACILYTKILLFCYFSFVEFEMWYYNLSSTSDGLDYSWSFYFHMNFRIIFLMSLNKSLEI